MNAYIYCHYSLKIITWIWCHFKSFCWCLQVSAARFPPPIRTTRHTPQVVWMGKGLLQTGYSIQATIVSSTSRYCTIVYTCTVEPHLSGPHLSGLFTYPDTCLGTNLYASTESDSLIRKFSYLDSQSGNGGVRISEAPL